ncbi:serine--tRNA ligase, partial [Enterococcus faecalis]
LDEERRALLVKDEELKKHRNQVSGEIGQSKRAEKDASQQLLNMQEVSEQIQVLEQEVVHLQEQCTPIAERLPKLPHESVP